MKRLLKIYSAITAVILTFAMSACSPVDKLYGVESSEPDNSKTEIASDYSYPNIMSADTVMPNYVDISLYDEENYADIYLGKKFKFNVSYDGSELTVPTTYKSITKKGWSFLENSQYDTDSMILAGETCETEFINENGVKITAFFYNSSKSSLKLSKCNIVKFRIENNNIYNPSSEYGDFNINGITNSMAITDITDTLGSPSHFYALSENQYYLDYFISRDDRRNGITVYVDPTDDSITSIEFSFYK